MLVHVNASEAEEYLQPVEEPARWGTITEKIAAKPGVLSPLVTGPTPTIESVNERSTNVRSLLHAYPKTPHDLAPIVVVLPPAWEGREMNLAWRATAKNTRGEITGTAFLVPSGDDEAADEEPFAATGAATPRSKEPRNRGRSLCTRSDPRRNRHGGGLSVPWVAGSLLATRTMWTR